MNHLYLLFPFYKQSGGIYILHVQDILMKIRQFFLNTLVVDS